MLGDLLTTFGIILAGLLLYRFRVTILAAVQRFDRANRDRIEEQKRERMDPLAHFRHTLALAEEQFEPVSEIVVNDPRLATKVTRYIFLGEQFASRDGAERARAEKVREKAREFYRELPMALASRGDGKLGRD